MVTRLKTLSEVEMAFRNEKQSLGCLKMGLKDNWSFSHFRFQGAKFSHHVLIFALEFAPCQSVSLHEVMALVWQRGWFALCETISHQEQQPCEFGFWIFATWMDFRKLIRLFGSCFASFPTFGSCFAEEKIFASCFAPCENWFGLCKMPLVCYEGVSHGAKIFAP